MLRNGLPLGTPRIWNCFLRLTGKGGELNCKPHLVLILHSQETHAPGPENESQRIVALLWGNRASDGMGRIQLYARWDVWNSVSGLGGNVGEGRLLLSECCRMVGKHSIDSISISFYLTWSRTPPPQAFHLEFPASVLSTCQPSLSEEPSRGPLLDLPWPGPSPPI